ncbi:sugar transferase [Enterococcus sp. AZ163]|uniref:sugar transferase n=1 Tax=Enterococcus sp. AZ163 TaxID=2774638 RepID=UPI003D26CB79
MSLANWLTYIVEGKSVDSVSKARNDISLIGDTIEFQRLYIYRYVDSNEDDRALIARIDGITAGVSAGDMIVYQYPSYNSYRFELNFLHQLKKRGATVVLLIHDSELLRGNNIPEELNLLNQSDWLITHSKKMEQQFILMGVKTPMLTKPLFDYLIPDSISLDSSLDKSIVFAGNIQKSVFLSNWPSKTKIAAFGTKGEIQFSKQVSYGGTYQQEELLRRMPKNRFGIAWDDNLQQGGNYQNYTRYNAPHKVSLYLALGLPVIVWKNAAIAEWISKYQLGFAIDSLKEIDLLFESLSTDELLKLKKRVNKFSQLLRKGIFTRNALLQVERDSLFKEVEDSECQME